MPKIAFKQQAKGLGWQDVTYYTGDAIGCEWSDVLRGEKNGQHDKWPFKKGWNSIELPC